MIEFGEWLPDQSSAVNTDILNVYPSANGYVPFKRFNNIYSALAERARGALSTVADDGNVYTYVGTETKIYKALATPVDVTRSGDAYATSSENVWEFARWANQCIGTNFTDEVQVNTLGGANFADLGGSPPNAKHLAVVKDFVVLGSVASNPDRVVWSAFNDATGWTNGTDQSGLQDFAGGEVIKVIGGNYGVIFQARSIRRMDYVGTPLVFFFTEIEPERGAWMPGGVVQYGSNIYYISKDGFYVLQDGTTSKPIGGEKVNRYFLADLDTNYLYRVTAAVDIANSSIVWCYPGVGNSGGTPNKAIIYNYVTNSFSRAEFDIDLIYRSLAVGYTLEELNTFGTIDTLPYSLDSAAWSGGQESLGGFDTSYQGGSFSGAALDARIDTPETGGEERQYITGVRPFVEGGTPSIQMMTRNSLNENRSAGTDTAINTRGVAPVRSNSRYYKVRTNITGGFDHAVGIDVVGRDAGKQ